ncbi:hypothetical protein E2I00_003806, partial [Balaenoptera physalus]
MVMGITDVDDKIIKRANEMNVSPASLANLYEEDFKQDMAALKVLPPTVYLRLHGHLYETGNVYFDLQSRGDRYGKLVGVAPAPVGETGHSDKRHASDFALWKAAKPREPSWASPWGAGRPGWHTECSTIASLVFGSRLDIHSGGIDLAFPHHENEIAQCEVFHQCQQWGNYFLHSGHLHVKGKEEKMSKSLQNYITIKDFLSTASPDVFRLFCLRSSYRSGELAGRPGCSSRAAPGSLWGPLGTPESGWGAPRAVGVLPSCPEVGRLLRAVAAFVGDARAYMRGQLAGGPVQEDVLWERWVLFRAARGSAVDTGVGLVGAPGPPGEGQGPAFGGAWTAHGRPCLQRWERSKGPREVNRVVARAGGRSPAGGGDARPGPPCLTASKKMRGRFEIGFRDGLRPRPPGADLPGVGALAFQEPSLGDLSQEAGGPRSPAVFGAIVSYVEQFFETVGISLAERQCGLGSASAGGWGAERGAGRCRTRPHPFGTSLLPALTFPAQPAGGASPRDPGSPLRIDCYPDTSTPVPSSPGLPPSPLGSHLPTSLTRCPPHVYLSPRGRRLSPHPQQAVLCTEASLPDAPG